MVSEALRRRIESELAEAEASRNRGNEGRARVCARRAAGWAIAALRDGQASANQGANAYVLLEAAGHDPQLPDPVRRAARRLAARVTPEHKLPHAEDPLDDARLIVRTLLGRG